MHSRRRGLTATLKNPAVTRAAENSCTNRIIGVIAPFCPRAFLPTPDQSGRWLVGAVGIEIDAFSNPIASARLCESNPGANRY
jgi:hypothetical protein